MIPGFTNSLVPVRSECLGRWKICTFLYFNSARGAISCVSSPARKWFKLKEHSCLITAICCVLVPCSRSCHDEPHPYSSVTSCSLAMPSNPTQLGISCLPVGPETFVNYLLIPKFIQSIICVSILSYQSILPLRILIYETAGCPSQCPESGEILKIAFSFPLWFRNHRNDFSWASNKLHLDWSFSKFPTFFRSSFS